VINSRRGLKNDVRIERKLDLLGAGKGIKCNELKKWKDFPVQFSGPDGLGQFDALNLRLEEEAERNALVSFNTFIFLFLILIYLIQVRILMTACGGRNLKEIVASVLNYTINEKVQGLLVLKRPKAGTKPSSANKGKKRIFKGTHVCDTIRGDKSVLVTFSSIEQPNFYLYVSGKFDSTSI
jgi:hypothetical protein